MWIYLILGILQGLFEWLPVSSEGITALTSQFFLLNANPVDIALFLHLGTFFAILVYFRGEWKEVLTLKNPPLLRFLIIATVVSLVIGFPVYTLVREAAAGVTLLAVMGLGLLLTSYFHGSKTKSGLGRDKLAVVAGLLQGFSVIPGLSRSGSTIFGLSLGEFSPSEILRYSYMMSAPVVLVSSVYLLWSNPLLLEGWPSLASSFLIGLFTLSFLMKASQKINFRRFTLVFGLLCLLGAAIGFYAY